MARICDMDCCRRDAVATVEHPTKDTVDVCSSDLHLFDDDAVVRRLD